MTLEEQMIERKRILQGFGIVDVILWCHLSYMHKREEECFFSWTVFCTYVGREHQVSAMSWEQMVEKVTKLTAVKPETYEQLLAL